MHQYVKVMQSSGLFASIKEYVGKNHPVTVHGAKAIPSPNAVVEKVTNISEAIYKAVGTEPPSAVGPVAKPITLTGQPLLRIKSRKPTILWVGAEYCPYCAADRGL